MKIIRSNRKTLSLGINRQGEVEVRAPYGCSEARILQFIQEHSGWLEKRLREFKPQKEYTPEQVKALRQRAEAILPPKTAYYARLMGVTPAYVKITSARSRFGSCNSKKGICFSLYLMEKSEAAIDYVVVHELAHLKQMNHSPAFYREIEKILPDYRSRIKELKQ